TGRPARSPVFARLPRGVCWCPARFFSPCAGASAVRPGQPGRPNDRSPSLGQMRRFSSWRLSMTLSWIGRMLREGSWPVPRSGRKQYRRPSPARPRAEALEDRQVPTVSFFGGNLLPHVQAQALFLGREFSSAPANAETATLDAFLKDLTGGPYLQTLARAGYGVG